MGIKGLMPFISDHAPLAVKETEMKALTGRTIAIDACAPWPPRTQPSNWLTALPPAVRSHVALPVHRSRAPR